MKKIYFFFFIAITIFSGTISQAQRKENPFITKNDRSGQKGNSSFASQNIIVPYTFSYSTGTYSNLTGSTSLNGGLTWDDPNFPIPIGFNFVLWSDTIDSLLTAGLGGWVLPASGPFVRPFISYFNDVADRASDTTNWSGQPGSLSTISYLTSGSPGSRILKIEWNNAGFYDDIWADNTSTDYLNFQMWLYEGSNNIEIRFGPSSILQDSIIYWGYQGPAIGVGLYDLSMDTADVFSVQGNPSSPTASLVEWDSTLTTITGDAPNGIIYKFNWFFVGVHEFDSQGQMVDIFPNPVSKHTSLLWKNPGAEQKVEMEITDIAGKAVMREIIYFNTNNIATCDLSPLNAGVYLMKLEAKNSGSVFKKLIKQ